MKLSVIVPCYNEFQSLNRFYDEVETKLKNEKITHELIFVDDGSSDDTLSILKELSKNNKSVKVISFSRNFGKEAAMLAGLDHANGEYIAIMDADLQHTPDVLVNMYNKLIENKEYDVVCSYKENRNKESRVKKVLVSLFYRINNNVSNVKMLPGAGDFRVFKKEVKDAIISLRENNRFLKGMFSWVGFNTIYMPYTPNDRVYGKTKWSLFKLIKYSLNGLVAFSTKPLKLSFVLGIITFIVALVNFILMGKLGFKVVILFLGFLMYSVGILSLYLSKMYDGLLNRPCYIIKEKINL